MIMKKLPHHFLSALLTFSSIAFSSTTALASQKFINSCIKSETGTLSECKCFAHEAEKLTNKKEYTFMIELMKDDEAHLSKLRAQFSDKELETVVSKLGTAARKCS